MKKAVLTACLIGMLTTVCFVSAARAEEPKAAGEEKAFVDMPKLDKKPLIQMAILLDTSSSMSGLIDQARTELWAIVNEFIVAKRSGLRPELWVALYEYGKSSLSQQEGYIRMIVPLTTDLDKISEELFALKTNGGQEYCGWVIKDATEDLQWSNSPDDLKVIFIAGNEPFTQGKVDYRQACKDAVSRGIIINTIHCGSEKQGLDGKWKDGAELADGRYLNIDQNRQVVHIEAPQDSLIAELGLKLNETYIPYGQIGDMASARQTTQDRNAATASKEAEVQRAVTKSSANYRNEAWDLVDAVQNDKLELENVKDQELPEQMRRMTAQERKAYVETKAKERARIQQNIQQLNEQRKKYVAQEMKTRQQGENTLGSAIIHAIREQANKKNLTFEPGQTQ
ncbi:MAG TPA: hypothetical protein VMW16_07565 [Sedimentisphaerales bacterium]|nr:hypothetical protein [Sedimentisphaerales bacterium]